MSYHTWLLCSTIEIGKCESFILGLFSVVLGQGLETPRQVLYHLSYSTSPLAFRFFVLLFFFLR
jgi:hypothetical protein